MNKSEILKQARENYKSGTYILSATKNLKRPVQVTGKIKWSENYPNCLVSEGFGIIYDGTTNVWAEIVN
jgi:hypothetical protein